jgi:hypothetical protein
MKTWGSGGMAPTSPISALDWRDWSVYSYFSITKSKFYKARLISDPFFYLRLHWCLIRNTEWIVVCITMYMNICEHGSLCALQHIRPVIFWKHCIGRAGGSWRYKSVCFYVNAKVSVDFLCVQTTPPAYLKNVLSLPLNKLHIRRCPFSCSLLSASVVHYSQLRTWIANTGKPLLWNFARNNK